MPAAHYPISPLSQQTEIRKINTSVGVAGHGVVYVAPAMILHYIEAHQYKPPKEFITAVLKSPEQDPPPT